MLAKRRVRDLQRILQTMLLAAATKEVPEKDIKMLAFIHMCLVILFDVRCHGGVL